MDTQAIITDITAAADIVEKIASVVSLVDPALAIGGITVSKLVSTAVAASQGAADAVAYIDNMKALAASTSAPTPEQWAALDARTDADVQKLEDSTKA